MQLEIVKKELEKKSGVKFDFLRVFYKLEIYC